MDTYNRRGNKLMGKVKAMAMQLEEDFLDTAESIIGECETYDEFVRTMEPHFRKLPHLDMNEIHDIVGEAWGEYWSKYV